MHFPNVNWKPVRNNFPPITHIRNGKMKMWKFQSQEQTVFFPAFSGFFLHTPWHMHSQCTIVLLFIQFFSRFPFFSSAISLCCFADAFYAAFRVLFFSLWSRFPHFRISPPSIHGYTSVKMPLVELFHSHPFHIYIRLCSPRCCCCCRRRRRCIRYRPIVCVIPNVDFPSQFVGSRSLLPSPGQQYSSFRCSEGATARRAMRPVCSTMSTQFASRSLHLSLSCCFLAI